MGWLKLLVPLVVSNSYVKSLLLGTSGVLGTYLVQWLSTTDFGPVWTPILSAGLPVVINAINKWREGRKKAPEPAAIDVSPLRSVTIKHDDDVPFAWLIVAGLALSGVALADPPRAVIQGNEAGVSGGILILDATLSSGEPTHFRWDIEPKISGRLQLVSGDGGELDRQEARKVQVATIPGTYMVRLIVSNADGNDDAARKIVIPGVMPTPPTPTPAPEPSPAPRPPSPGPAPAPEPSLPSGQFGIIHTTRDLARGVTSPNKSAELTCLIGGCTGVEAQVAAGTLRTPQAIILAMGDVLQSCVTPAWNDVRNRLADKVDALFKAGSLRTVDDCRIFVGELRQGLEAAR